ncbi:MULTISPECIES: hypothetical protein [unclassified Pseudomonas]|uniref:hypothetical protein n=1 Tax=unclassified Pseudomonas TaxID=196821 RepID=UPI001473778E|nr:MULTISPECIES: hypothetical protein [unclassified Pseudomonas]NMX92364.1 hypothetical protein [Pseudomonas sp. WS 5086]NMY47288.1 hypothetical protein [Pseudomonas sp. WS 5027]
MPSDARVEIKNGDVKSTGTMEGDISIGDAKSSYFRADSVHYVNSRLALQVMGTQGEAEKSTVIAASLRPQTPSGSYKLGGSEINDLSYYPPRGDLLWTVTGGGINITFDEDGKRAHGTLQIFGKHLQQTLEVLVSFDVRN